MKRFFGKIENGQCVLEGDEHNHLKNVLRLNQNESVVIITGDGFEHICEILKIDKNKTILAEKSKKICKNNPKNTISLFISAIKREKLELVVQKAVEEGVINLYVFESQFSAMKLKDEKMERWQKIVVSSLKQCERADLMNVQKIDFETMLSLFKKCQTRLFANEREGKEFDFSSLKNAKDIGILIGCEGGFSPEEKQKILSQTSPENVSLGERILRAETAAILLCGISSLFSKN